MYGHVGNGNLHTRPIIDIGRRSEIDLLKSLPTRYSGKWLAMEEPLQESMAMAWLGRNTYPGLWDPTVLTIPASKKNIWP